MFQLLEEIAAKEEEEVNKKPKDKDESKEKTKKDKGKAEEQVQSCCYINYLNYVFLCSKMLTDGT